MSLFLTLLALAGGHGKIVVQSQHKVIFSFDARLGAFVALVGVAAGVFLTLVPNQLIDKRNAYARRAAMWRSLRLESGRIRQICREFSGTIRKATSTEGLPPNIVRLPVRLTAFNPAPTIVWQLVVSDGDFLSEMPQILLEQLGEAYAKASLINISIEQYYRLAMKDGELQTLNEAVHSVYTDIAEESDQLAQSLAPLEGTMQQQEQTNAMRAKRMDRLLWKLGILGVILTVLFSYVALSGNGFGLFS